MYYMHKHSIGILLCLRSVAITLRKRIIRVKTERILNNAK